MGAAQILETFEDASELFRALSSPIRIAIIRQLTDGERCVHELVEQLALPQPLVSQHLRVLREADLVQRVRRGREVAYGLTDEHVAHIVQDAVRHSDEREADEHAGTPRARAIADGAATGASKTGPEGRLGSDPSCRVGGGPA